MNAFLETAKPPFKNLRWSRVLKFIEILSESKFTKRSFICRKYEQQFPGFDNVCQFLLALGLIIDKKDSLVLDNKKFLLPTRSAVQLRNCLLINWIVSESLYKKELFSYLQCFSSQEGILRYRPLPSDRTLFSDLRNFLMDLKVISYNHEAGFYELSGNDCFLYQAARTAAGTVKPATLEAALKRKKSIGLKAEQAVLEFERKRVPACWNHAIQHVSQSNEAAGYDIQSISEVPDGVQFRYIEVKAVSSQTQEFFWTANEVETAERFAELYYLYLVPVKSAGRIDIDALRIIKNPHKEIFDGDSVWEIEQQVTRCRHVEKNF